MPGRAHLLPAAILCAALVLLIVLAPPAAKAQQALPDTVAGTATETVVAPAVLDSAGLARSSWIYRADHRVLLGVYRQDAPAFAAAMRAADQSAYPTYFGAIPASWGTALATDAGYRAAYRVTISELLAVGSTVMLKHAFGRIRPFVVLKRVRSRSGRLTRTVVLTQKRYSFPSGHAATAFALATSASLSFPRWYVIGPGLAWAAAISTSRLWLGVHYPSDVLAGALLGAAVATGVHLFRSALTPAFLKKENGDPMQTTAPMLRVRLALP